MTADDFEIFTTGKKFIDLDLLKRHTKYSGDLKEDSPRIKYLWETLYSLSEVEKLRFVKFCWGKFWVF